MDKQSVGYQSLYKAIMADAAGGRSLKERMAKLDFAVERAEHYAAMTGVSAEALLTAWEERRDYWYVNYYQEANQPRLDGNQVRVFDNTNSLIKSIGTAGFRCPHCQGVSKSPYVCDSGEVINGKVCDWKSYGLFGTLGKGFYVFAKYELRGEHIFMPINWEQESDD